MGSCLACNVPLGAVAGSTPRKWCSPACRIWALRNPGERRQRVRKCAACGVDISALQYKAKVCSKRCAGVVRGATRAAPLTDRDCVICAVTFTPRSLDSKYWSTKCKNKRPRKAPKTKHRYNDVDRDRYQRKRARKKGASTGRPVRKAEIAARDRYLCGICGCAVDMTLAWPHRMSSSLDHIDPLSLGGAHDPANVRLAHLTCNIARGNRGGGEQLMLIG